MNNKKILIILGNQLFPIEKIKKVDFTYIFMKEDIGLCTDYNHHKLKIIYFLTSMREYRDYLINHGLKVIYHGIENDNFEKNYFEVLNDEIKNNKIKTLNYFEIEDNSFAEEFLNFISSSDINTQKHSTPMFLNTKHDFENFAKNHPLRMSSFYQISRKKLKLLLDENEKPLGGKWSFDSENRKKLPREIQLPSIKKFDDSKHFKKISKYVSKRFNLHPGSSDNLWIPTCRKDALILLDDFFNTRFSKFGTYEDAINTDNNFLFHSFLSPILNIGLLTPDEVIKKAMNFSDKNSIPINSLEGFIRQIIGWREFIRGIYHLKGKEQENLNFFKHERRLSEHWYSATTDILPLDDSIKNCLKYGYTHHIPRLMIIANIMTLSRIHPKEIYKWFMEMFIDSSEWVMIPNVFGMGTFADGGIFATKPYSCGSNYILKMSNYRKDKWCNTLDGLYWKFIHDNRSFFEKNPRLSIIPRSLDKMDKEKKQTLFENAENFISTKTK